MRDLGFSEGRVFGWLHGGRLHQRYPGVYAFGRRDLSERGQLAAALLFAGRGAALSGLTSLWWMRLFGRRPDRIHVDAPGRAVSFGDVAIRHPRQLERLTHRGLPTVRLPDALLAAASSLSHDSLRLVLARADFRHLLSLQELHESLGKGRSGSRKVRAALTAHLPELARCESPLEVDFLLLCERLRLPIPEPNVRIGRHRPDMLWLESRLIVELDGEDAHSSAAQIAADARRQAALEARGYTVLRFTSRQLRNREAIRSAIIAACESPPQRTSSPASPR